MLDSSVRVGVLHAGPRSGEQDGALAWLEATAAEATAIRIDQWADPARCDAYWWHRTRPLGDDRIDDAAIEAIESAVADGSGLVLSSRALAAVDRFDFEPVPPDVRGVDHVHGPTGIVWRSLYEDHPAVDRFNGLEITLCDRGEVPVTRYETVLPERGEILGSLARDGALHADEMSVVSWAPGDGAVIGLGAPVVFDDHDAAIRVEARDDLLAGCLSAVAGRASQLRPSRPKSAVELSALRRGLTGDHQRPGYHITPPANWLNDPNGLIRWNGQYHVFYQYNPAGPFHSTIHWGHAVSDDLLHWRDRPVALSPSPDGPDRLGCWSGCAIDDDGTATLLYTGGRDRVQLPCLATTDDPGLDRWHKDPANPIIEAPPTDPALLETEHWTAEFRDHCVWRADDTYHQLIGAGLESGGGAVLLYTSPDLREWTYQGPILEDADGSDGTVWECPELLDLGERDLLHISNYVDVRYFLGEMDDDTFAVQRQGLLDHGDFYAPQSLDDGDRCLTWGWLPESRDERAQWDAGWSGLLSLPRVLSVDEAGRLRQRPAGEVTDLRTGTRAAIDGLALDDDRRSLDAAGRAIEIELTVALDDASAFELSVFESPDGAERTPIRYTSEGTLRVVREHSTADERASTETQTMAVPPHDEPLDLRVFLDGSVIELFANERHCLTSRVYPSAESTGLSIAATDGRAIVDSLTVRGLETGVFRPAE